ncbi:unnamed protein product [Arabis nemorensis]|uniref:Uncharacterized protein n=1 Tax=Arabis nemorensis TaxID=586526 RepID=A0A565BRS8_9BRAS|nr:unnamed protein product [Arabis nemorensis]
MARWDHIFSLPVQNPTLLEFSSADLVWSKIEGYQNNIDRLALIPFSRIDDFVSGKSSNQDCPTNFHAKVRRRKPKELKYKPKVDGILEYWCSFGLDDNRKGSLRPSRSTYVLKKNNAGRPNSKRGCRCHFIVNLLIVEPTVALIIYNNDKHVDEKGLPCHGPQDKKAAGTRAMCNTRIRDYESHRKMLVKSNSKQPCLGKVSTASCRILLPCPPMSYLTTEFPILQAW